MADNKSGKQISSASDFNEAVLNDPKFIMIKDAELEFTRMHVKGKGPFGESAETDVIVVKDGGKPSEENAFLDAIQNFCGKHGHDIVVKEDDTIFITGNSRVKELLEEECSSLYSYSSCDARAIKSFVRETEIKKLPNMMDISPDVFDQEKKYLRLRVSDYNDPMKLLRTAVDVAKKFDEKIIAAKSKDDLLEYVIISACDEDKLLAMGDAVWEKHQRHICSHALGEFLKKLCAEEQSAQNDTEASQDLES